MFGLQPLHLLLIIVVALIIFGPKRLPEIGRALGKSINEFKAASREVTDSLTTEVQSSPTQPQPVAPVVQPAPNTIAQQPVVQPVANTVVQHTEPVRTDGTQASS